MSLYYDVKKLQGHQTNVVEQHSDMQQRIAAGLYESIVCQFIIAVHGSSAAVDRVSKMYFSCLKEEKRFNESISCVRFSLIALPFHQLALSNGSVRCLYRSTLSSKPQDFIDRNVTSQTMKVAGCLF